MFNTVAPNTPCHVPHPDIVSEFGLSELPSSIHFDDKANHDAFFVQTCVEEVEQAEYATPQKPIFSMRGGEQLDEGLDPTLEFYGPKGHFTQKVPKKQFFRLRQHVFWIQCPQNRGGPHEIIFKRLI